MPGDPVPLHELDEVPRLVKRQRRLCKMWVFRKKIARPAVQIRKIAPAAAGDQNLSPGLPIVLQQHNPLPALPSHRPAHYPSRPRPQDNHIELAQFRRHRVPIRIAAEPPVVFLVRPIANLVTSRETVPSPAATPLPPSQSPPPTSASPTARTTSLNPAPGTSPAAINSRPVISGRGLTVSSGIDSYR